MAIKAFKPTSPARRYYEVADFKKLDGNDSRRQEAHRAPVGDGRP